MVTRTQFLSLDQVCVKESVPITNMFGTYGHLFLPGHLTFIWALPTVSKRGVQMAYIYIYIYGAGTGACSQKIEHVIHGFSWGFRTGAGTGACPQKHDCVLVFKRFVLFCEGFTIVF